MLYREAGRPDVPEIAERATREMRGYIVDAVADRLRSPRGDLLSTIAAAHGEGRLSIEEVDRMCRLLLLAGVHTTSSLIANALMLLEHRPADRAALARDPGRIPAAIEELLRYLAPVQSGARVTTRDVEARIAFEALFTRVPEYEIVGPVERHFTFLERGIASLPAVVQGSA